MGSFNKLYVTHPLINLLSWHALTMSYFLNWVKILYFMPIWMTSPLSCYIVSIVLNCWNWKIVFFNNNFNYYIMVYLFSSSSFNYNTCIYLKIRLILSSFFDRNVTMLVLKLSLSMKKILNRFSKENFDLRTNDTYVEIYVLDFFGKR